MEATLPLPQGYLVEQQFERPVVTDIPAAVRSGVATLQLADRIRPGETVAVAVGSRGVRGIDGIVKAVVDALKALHASPFIVPAMGSHGGGTAEGQREVLANYGISEEQMGCELRATMDVVEIGRTRLDTPVFLDRHAAAADHVAVVNRVKPHTNLIGPIESGLLKMCLIGLGNQEGARTYHRAIDHHSWREILESGYEVLIQHSPIRFGLAVVQNAYEEIAKLSAVAAEDFLRVEPELLEEARRLTGRLPFEDVDLLVVDEMGKEISGTGMDTNITGRKDGSPSKVVRVFVRDLTERSHGNAQGIGLADFTTRRLVDRIDFNAVYLNSLTAYRTDTCKIPMTFDTDREVLRVATQMAAVEDPTEYKLVWIRNTLELERIFVSEAYRKRVEGRNDLQVVGGPFGIQFDADGNLISPFA
jgi:hypothetical protein